MAEYASCIATHYSNVLEDDGRERSASEIFNLRKFNNFIKTLIIDKYITSIKDNKLMDEKIIVLDICCGKGGDMKKWLYGDAYMVVFVDIAEQSIIQCQERYKNLKETEKGHIFKAVFIHADCFKDNLKEKFAENNIANIKFDLISCQFALHYAFESFTRLKQMIKSITQNMSPKGFFIGTITDAYQLMNILRTLPLNSKDQGAKGEVKDENPYTFTNGICSIIFEHSSFSRWREAQSLSVDGLSIDSPEEHSLPPPLTGANYHFTLDNRVNCPEFLAYFPLLEKLLKLEGLRCVLKKNFHKYAHEHRNNVDARKLAERMRIYEPYRGSFNAPQSSFKSNSDIEYEELKKHLRVTQQERNTQPATISKSEWEVIGCYLAFAFQKS